MARIFDSSGNPLGDEFRLDMNPDADSDFGWTTGVVLTYNGLRIDLFCVGRRKKL